MTALNINALPRDPWDQRAVLLTHDVSERVASGVSFLRDAYRERAQLCECMTFIFEDLDDAPRSDFDSLRRVWIFPWRAIQQEMGEALNHALLGAYRAAFDNYRRGLELALVGAYFLQAHIPESEGRKWMHSELQTPMFSRAKAEVLKNSRFRLADSEARWSSEISDYYWRLCDVVHVRGEKASLDRFQPTHFIHNGVSLPEFAQDRAEEVADAFIETTRHIATIVALENPVLLVGLELFSKFGLNPPMSGFFDCLQANRVGNLVLAALKPGVVSTLLQDQEVIDIQNWVENLPELTSEQIAEQAKHQDEIFDFGAQRAAGDLDAGE